jgi:DNA-binding response OmpR family regulator
MRIAILQRDPVMRQSIEKVLMSASHTCMAYDDGLSMSKALARSTVDLLVLDWHGTRLSGAEVLRSVRAVGGDRLPVLFASAETSEESVVRAFASGADDYVALPLRPGEFRERVAALLRRAYPDRFSAASFDVGPYHFDTACRPQTDAWKALFKICSISVQNWVWYLKYCDAEYPLGIRQPVQRLH